MKLHVDKIGPEGLDLVETLSPDWLKTSLGLESIFEPAGEGTLEAHFERLNDAIHVNGSGPEPRLGLFFETRNWIGEPINREPSKCSGITWFPFDDLPEHLIEYPAAGIDAYRRGLAFSLLGWPADAVRSAVAQIR